jgi:mono/diheme cytochrome c family protein
LARDIEAFIHAPQAINPGTTMPSLLRDGEAEKDASAIAAFLASLSSHSDVKALEADVDRGRGLYHSVGCVACHSPEPGYRPEGLAESVKLSQMKTLSAPIGLARFYSHAALATFLLDPLKVRPSGRMPGMKLSPQEAADLSSYLLRDQKLRGGKHQGNSVTAAQKGRSAFASRKCVACHALSEDPISSIAKSLESLKPDSPEGCLGDAPSPAAADYSLSKIQKNALRAALSALKESKPLTASERVHRTMASFNCYACHERNGIGGPEPGRSQFFRTALSATESLGDEGRIPPSLSRVGYKLTPNWLQKILNGKGDVRPYMKTRMPVFGVENVHSLPPDFFAADIDPAAPLLDLTGRQRHQRSFVGRKLMGVNGLNCITCHGLKGNKSLGVPAVDLADTTERLRPEWFREYLLDPQRLRPRTLMPAFFPEGRSPVKMMMSGNNAVKQIDQLWMYLKEVDQQPLPDGMVKETFELKPEKQPIVFRTFMQHAGMQAIAVGFPQGVHVAFDSKEIRWAVAWHGKFLDAESTWRDRFTPLAKPLGKDVKTFPKWMPLAILKNSKDVWPGSVGVNAGYRFLGFKLDKARVPAFLYSFNGMKIEDRIEPDGRSLMRILKIEGKTDGLFYRDLDGKISAVGTNELQETYRW